jgi:exopolysaccharide biosynthesis polyprenyl glycosylphosphotransferase
MDAQKTLAADAARLYEVPRTSEVSSARRAAREVRTSDDTVVLPSRQFLKQVQVEKRRADRTKSPLSLVLIHLEGRGGLATTEELLGLLSENKRETDILGYAGEDRIGLLLPHTGESGLQVFVRGVWARAVHLPIAIASGTYPDCVFDKLASTPSDVSDNVEQVLDEAEKVSRANAIAKRVLDVVGAVTALVLFSPIMLATAIAVAMTSRGPVIFRQKRIGKDGAPFVFYKFRSMKADADDSIHRNYVANLIDGKHSEINQGDAGRPVYKMMGDPRITPVGRFIRKTSIDELPQLFNVLKGEMSLVGPRPPLLYEAEKYQSWHLRRILRVRPGITGLWQVEGRSSTSFDDMVRLDLRYIRSQSIWQDLKILLMTVKAVLTRHGAG